MKEHRRQLLAVVGSVVVVLLALLVVRLITQPSEEALAQALGHVAVGAVVEGSTPTPTAQATVVPESEREALPTVGDTQTTSDGLDITLIFAETWPNIPVSEAQPVKPRKDTWKVIQIRYENPGSSTVGVGFSKMGLVTPDGTVIRPNPRGTLALGTSPRIQGYGVEAHQVVQTIPPKFEYDMAVAFDLKGEQVKGLRFEINGLVFALPD